MAEFSCGFWIPGEVILYVGEVTRATRLQKDHRAGKRSVNRFKSKPKNAGLLTTGNRSIAIGYRIS